MSILCLLQRQSRKICTPKLPQNTYPITESGQLHIYSVISNFTHFLRSHCVHLKFPLNSFRVKGTTTTTTKNRTQHPQPLLRNVQALGGETPGRGAAGVHGPSTRGGSAVTRLTTHLRRAAQAVAPESRRAVDGRPEDLNVVSTPRSVSGGTGGRSEVVMLHDPLQHHLAAVGARRRLGESSGWVFGWPRNR